MKINFSYISVKTVLKFKEAMVNLFQFQIALIVTPVDSANLRLKIIRKMCPSLVFVEQETLKLPFL